MLTRGSGKSLKVLTAGVKVIFSICWPFSIEIKLKRVKRAKTRRKCSVWGIKNHWRPPSLDPLVKMIIFIPCGLKRYYFQYLLISIDLCLSNGCVNSSSSPQSSIVVWANVCFEGGDLKFYVQLLQLGEHCLNQTVVWCLFFTVNKLF